MLQQVGIGCPDLLLLNWYNSGGTHNCYEATFSKALFCFGRLICKKMDIVN